jgi:thiamine biosynthesis protein ThiI
MQRLIIIHYSELALKKGNRDFFENRLLRNIDEAVADLDLPRARRISGRMLLEVPLDRDAATLAQIKVRLGRVFGIAWYGEGRRVDWAIETLEQTSWALAQDVSFGSFAVDTRRPDKRFPMTSVEVNQQVGAYVQVRSGARVDLGNPDLRIQIELVEGQALVVTERLPGAGGLPSHTGGKVAVLLSGGIDSPVAAWRMMRRGCTAIFVHFHSFPHTTRESQDKARQVVELLAGYQGRGKLYLVAFADIQRRIMVGTPAETRVVLYRRYMMRLAESIAKREKARLLVTGDALGQVASQTLENLDVVSRAVAMPILRPLVGSDKEEIIRVARAIGTYPISILPDQDCCSLFVPKHPETRSSLAQIEPLEAGLDVSAEMQAALDTAEVLVQYPAYETGAVRQF